MATDPRDGILKNMTNAIDASGRIVIPKHLRDELGFRPGVPLTITSDGVGLRIEPTRQGGRLVMREGYLVVESETRRVVTDSEIREALEAGRHRADGMTV